MHRNCARESFPCLVVNFEIEKRTSSQASVRRRRFRFIGRLLGSMVDGGSAESDLKRWCCCGDSCDIPAAVVRTLFCCVEEQEEENAKAHEMWSEVREEERACRGMVWVLVGKVTGDCRG